VHARVEDCIRTGKDCGIGRFPSHDFVMNSAWLAASLIAAALLSWLRLIALDGDLACAEPKGQLIRKVNRSLDIQSRAPYKAG